MKTSRMQQNLGDLMRRVTGRKKSKKDIFLAFMRDYGYEILVCIAGFTLLSLLLWFRLASLTYGNAAAIEITSQLSAHSFQAIIDNPLNAPYTLMQKVLLLNGYDGILAMRFISTLWGIVAMVVFYFVARQWHSPRVASLATWLFISSAWFLHTARLATPEVLWLVGMLTLVMLFSPNKNGRHTFLAFPSLLIVLSLLLYIPGMAWLVAVSVVLQRRNISEAWQATRAWWLRALTIVGSLLVVTPLIYALSQHGLPLLKQWLGFTATFNSPRIMFNHFLSVPEQLFVSGPFDPAHWLGHIPLLSVFELAMFILGVYFYVTHLRAARARLVIVLSLTSWLVIGIGGLVSLSLIVPVVYLVVTTGIAYMLREWLKTFPVNPLARTIGIGVVMIAVLLTTVYQTRSYFIAWRYSPETAQVFTQKL